MIGDSGASKVLNALKTTSPHLLELNLQYNELASSKICDEIMELIQIRPNLEKVNLQGNEFKTSTKNKIREQLAKTDKENILTFDDEEDEELDDDDDNNENEDLALGVKNISLKDD